MSRLTAALDRISALEARIGMGHNNGPPLDEDDGRELIPDAEVAYRLGITVRTLIRWDEKSELAFPKPVRVNGRKFRRPVEIARWVAKRAKVAVPRRPMPRTVRHSKRAEVL
jgi:predicted DNA-binding transcriptional regulator AlpA